MKQKHREAYSFDEPYQFCTLGVAFDLEFQSFGSFNLKVSPPGQWKVGLSAYVDGRGWRACIPPHPAWKEVGRDTG